MRLTLAQSIWLLAVLAAFGLVAADALDILEVRTLYLIMLSALLVLTSRVMPSLRELKTMNGRKIR